MTQIWQERFGKFGIHIPQIMLPNDDVSLERFAVIACDQHSAEPEYWEETRRLVKDAPSALHLMLPEAWLSEKEKLEPQIIRTMKVYLENGTLESLGEGFIYVRRQVGTKPSGQPLYRHGLMVCLDLDCYDYIPGNHALIRATEQTVRDRLPERIRIRQEAPLELPHILVLLNDPDNQAAALFEDAVRRHALPRLYNFDLMQGGGHLLGYRVSQEEFYAELEKIFRQLLSTAPDGMLMAVGDGNHSLAAAKAVWEQRKEELRQFCGHELSPQETAQEKLRYALVELVSAYDEGLRVYPIHRLLMGLTPEQKASVEQEAGFSAEYPESLQTLQPKLDRYLDSHPNVRLEYIHGEETCRRLGQESGNLAVIFDSFPRDRIFSTVIEHGVFVRKSFSLGEPSEKRYYLEARKIR